MAVECLDFLMQMVTDDSIDGLDAHVYNNLLTLDLIGSLVNRPTSTIRFGKGNSNMQIAQNFTVKDLKVCTGCTKDLGR